MIAWEYTSQDTWEAHDRGVDFVATRIRDGEWFWEVIAVEHFISGPYPGTPDFHEHTLGSGHVYRAPGRTDDDAFLCVTAKWLAQRAWARALVREEVDIIEENAYLEEMERDAARDWEGEHMASEEAMLDARTEDY